MDTGTILIEPSVVAPSGVTQHVAVYVRVSSADNKGNLESQAERLAAYCAACRLLCGLPPTVRLAAYCAACRLLCGLPPTLRLAAYFAACRLLSGTLPSVRLAAYC